MPSIGRLHLLTDTRPGAAPLAVLRAALSVPVPSVVGLVVQVRVEDSWTDRQAYALLGAVLPLCRAAGALCLVNDRLHLALAAGADGGHVGADDLPVEAARRVLAAGSAADPVLGATCRTAAAARACAAAGATYLGVGPVYPTATKDGLPEAIGPAGVAAAARAVPHTPVVAIGGVTAARIPALLAAGAHGVAVVGAVAGAADPASAVADGYAALAAAAAARP
ncbi:MAG TPA: thiamine phosphate synthase, partial [Pilimelia sp.]|nr:thiamine phosphate synthase [Pilimelia sp.]